jgi:hypothetical protein
MVARMVRMQLQPTSVAAFSRTLAKNILPAAHPVRLPGEDRVVIELISLVHTWQCLSIGKPSTQLLHCRTCGGVGGVVADEPARRGRGFPIRGGICSPSMRTCLDRRRLTIRTYGRLREEDLSWNPLYETWVITRYDDVVWCLRHPELFRLRFSCDDRPPFPRSWTRTRPVRIQ